MTYHVEYSEKEIVLWIEAPCGFRQPLIRWSDIDSLKQLAEILLDFYKRKTESNEMDCENKNNTRTDTIAEKLLRQALGDDDEICK